METTVFLLLGGESRRMGLDKAHLLYQGQPFWTKIASRLSNVGQVVLSLRQEVPGLPYPSVIDRISGCGPLGGMLSCLYSCKTPLAFFCACDMPFLDADMPARLLRALSPEIQAVIPIEQSGKIQPLCGLYRRELLPLVQQQIDAKDFRLYRLLEQCRVCYLSLAQEPALARQLLNVNTPEDYQSFLDIIASINNKH